MPLPVFAGAGLVGLAEFLRVLGMRVLLVTLLYLAFNLVFQIAGSLFLGQGVIQSILQRVHGSADVWTISQAFQALPSYATQLFFFMHLDEAVAMVGATFTAILGLKLFGKVMETIGGV